jgi:hypothetical protein
MKELEKIIEFNAELAIEEFLKEMWSMGSAAEAYAYYDRVNKIAKQAQDEVGWYRCELLILSEDYRKAAGIKKVKKQCVIEF